MSNTNHVEGTQTTQKKVKRGDKRQRAGKKPAVGSDAWMRKQGFRPATKAEQKQFEPMLRCASVKTLGQIAYESDKRGGQQNFGKWQQAPQVVREIHERMAQAVKKAVLEREQEKPTITYTIVANGKFKSKTFTSDTAGGTPGWEWKENVPGSGVHAKRLHRKLETRKKRSL